MSAPVISTDSSPVGVALFPSFQHIFYHFTFPGFLFILISEVIMLLMFFAAIFIDAEEETEKDSSSITYSYWSYLPDLILEKVFSYLSIRERYYASMVCRTWYRAFHLPYVWSTFALDDSTLTRRKFNYYYGWQVWYKNISFFISCQINFKVMS